MTDDKKTIQNVIDNAEAACKTQAEENVVRSLTHRVQQAQAAIEKWTEQAATDPIYAIEWGATVVAETFQLREWFRALCAFNRDDRDELLKEQERYLRTGLMCGTFEQNSTSLLTRGAGEAKIIGARQAHQMLRSIRKMLATGPAFVSDRDDG